MSVHANREPQNPQFEEAQRLLRALIATAGPEAIERLNALKNGDIVLRIHDGALRDIHVPSRFSLQRVAHG